MTPGTGEDGGTAVIDTHRYTSGYHTAAEGAVRPSNVQETGMLAQAVYVDFSFGNVCALF